MPDFLVLLKVARDEIDTLIQYSELLESSTEQEKLKPILDEIRGDEFNHALISLLSAAKLMGISIATDDIDPDPNTIDVTE